jgi:hypothetical protein
MEMRLDWAAIPARGSSAGATLTVCAAQRPIRRPAPRSSNQPATPPPARRLRGDVQALRRARQAGASLHDDRGDHAPVAVLAATGRRGAALQ